MFLRFVTEYPSFALLLLSTILTGYFLEPSFSSVLVHMMNFGILLFVRYEARRNENYVIASVGICVSIGLSAVMIHPDNRVHALAILINFLLLLGMCAMAKTDQQIAPRTSVK
jgi:hypothetical protein